MLSVVTCELVVGNIRQCACISSPFCQEFTKQCTKPLPLEGLVILRCLCFVFFSSERPNRLDDVILIEGVKLHRKGKKKLYNSNCKQTCTSDHLSIPHGDNLTICFAPAKLQQPNYALAFPCPSKTKAFPVVSMNDRIQTNETKKLGGLRVL